MAQHNPFIILRPSFLLRKERKEEIKNWNWKVCPVEMQYDHCIPKTFERNFWLAAMTSILKVVSKAASNLLFSLGTDFDHWVLVWDKKKYIRFYFEYDLLISGEMRTHFLFMHRLSSSHVNGMLCKELAMKYCKQPIL